MVDGPAFLNFAAQTLSLRETRERLIATNVANADTPGYKATDIDFQAALQAALHGGIGSPKVEYVTDYPVGLNGNNVSPTMEKLESLNNVTAMNAETTFLHQQTSDLITALRPNPGGI